jgi:hypothetical protein
MDRKSKRTIISIEDNSQPELDFEEAAHLHPFTFPEYQRGLIAARITAGLIDLGIVAVAYAIFLMTTFADFRSINACSESMVCVSSRSSWSTSCSSCSAQARRPG